MGSCLPVLEEAEVEFVQTQESFPQLQTRQKHELTVDGLDKLLPGNAGKMKGAAR